MAEEYDYLVKICLFADNDIGITKLLNIKILEYSG